MSGLTLAIYWIGAGLINAAQAMDKLILFSNMVVFSAYAMQVIMSMMMLVMIFILLPRAMVSAKRINEVLDTNPTVVEGEGTQGLPGVEGEVTFEHVSFRYPGASEDVLHDVSFTAKKGETVAFIGSTGSGKSTVINLIPRFFDATEGTVLVDGVNVKAYRQEALNNKIGYVPQKAVLFRGSVQSNVAYGESAYGEPALEDVKRAVAIAQGTDFVEKMENTYEADISQSGTNISGGQKQRLSIARAVCRRPEIYIFDDSFSALDYRTDRDLRAALRQETEGVTSLIVAQRIGTIMNADRILVLDEGRVVGMHCLPAHVFSIVLSDIIGDPLDMIASGPAYPDSSTVECAQRIADKYRVPLTDEMRALLRVETPKTLTNVETVITGSVRELCLAAAQAASSLGYEPLILTDSLDCVAREAGAFFAALARYRQHTERSLALIAGGETVVRVQGNGLGGRNQELALAAAQGLRGLAGTALFSVGSDGTGGPTDAAGGYVDGDTADALEARGVDAYAALQNNDAYHAG